ncbi:uncharacterized protein LOC141661112 [Apium graveolens]|uniref:uncharacterized protein LOC141661112 n=1 Tax=Apium graveolens TaxID=4045 RepID=UPI003D7AA5C8
MIVGGNATSSKIMQIDPPLQAFRLTGTSISFSDADYPRGNMCRNGPLIVTLDMANQDVKKVLIDNGSSVDIIFKHALRRMILNTPLEDMKLEEIQGSVYGFGNHAVPVQGAIDIPTTFDTSSQEVTAMVKYYVIDMASPYNAIIGQPTLFFLEAIISSPHMKVKFPTPIGPGELITDHVASQYCYSTTLSLAQTQPKRRKPYGEQKEGSSPKTPRTSQNESSQVFLIKSSFSYSETSLTKAKLHRTPKVEPGEPVENIELVEGDPTRCIFIGSSLQPALKQELIQLLRESLDIFAWRPKDMPGLDESIAVHRLHVDPNKTVVKQKRRNSAPERQQAIDEEINKLLKTKFIYEIKFPEWISNVVLVKKTSSKWRVYIDFTDLNKATPKDYYPLPTIDQLVDATAGNVLFSFLDAFSKYNQIKLAPEDQAKTTFITHRAIYAYRVLPIGLMNAGATYQRTMNKIFSNQIGRNLEVYVDDMTVKSKFGIYMI